VATFRKANPEVMLLQYLRTFVQTNNVLDIGAHVGDVTDQLLSAGYRVFAFEPQPEAFDKLCARFEGVATFRPYETAIGSSDCSAQLFKLNLDARAKQLLSKEPSAYSTIVQHPLPTGAKYGERVEVKVRMLRSMHDAGEIPTDVSIVKIDTEGGDLEVIRGMGNTKYAIIMTSFWDGAYHFSGGEFGLLAPIVLHMRNRGYAWHLVIYRVFHHTHSTEPRYYCNIDQSVRSSWGHALFFRDYDLFSEAQKWCASMMPANQSFGL
jgi:FkbM family methyltransferase